MSTFICLPAHILDAAISPRAREVMMLLASQTTAKKPLMWICQAKIAERLRCSVSTVARAIQKLIEAKLIAETGQLHEGRYKFYHVRWSVDEDIRAVSKKITQPVRKVAVTKMPPKESAAKRFEGVQLTMPPVEEAESAPPTRLSELSLILPPTETTLPPPTPLSTITPQTIMKDSRLAYHAEIARKQHEESIKLYKAALLALR